MDSKRLESEHLSIERMFLYFSPSTYNYTKYQNYIESIKTINNIQAYNTPEGGGSNNNNIIRLKNKDKRYNNIKRSIGI